MYPIAEEILIGIEKDTMAIIMLSRGRFTGGRELAQSISEKLGYRFISREDIIEKTAQYGISKERLDRARRRRVGMLQRMDQEWIHYLVYARAALAKEIQQGSLVYLGSNGPALLRDFPTLLSVKVAADMEYRINSLIKHTDYVMDRKKARGLIEEIDKKKTSWQKKLHDTSWHDPSEFDLVVEPELMSISDACELILAKLEHPQYHTTNKSLEAIDLLTVAADLRARIAMEDAVEDDRVEVEVRDSEIAITGLVPSTEDRHGILELLDFKPEAREAAGNFKTLAV